MRFLTSILATALVTATAMAETPSADAAKYWPTWRGPEMTGVSRTANPPVEWSESKNLKWKIEIPGAGHASPIVWKDRVYVLTAVKKEMPSQASAGERIGIDGDVFASMQPGEGRRPRDGRRGGPGGRRGGRGRQAAPTDTYQFDVLAINRADGGVAWRKTVTESVPHEAGHPDSTQASNSPVTDGEHIFAHFGSRGLYCLDMEGNVKWSAEFGKMQTRNGFGEGSSPALFGDTIVVNWDHEGDSFIVALDKRTGKEKWRKPRDEPTSWATPLIVESKGKAQVVVNGTNAIRSYDLETGDVIWTCGGMTTNAIPSPVAADGTVIVMSGFRGAALVAIKYDGAKGDITGTDRVVWSHDKETPYVPSPLLYDQYLYFTKNTKGLLTCFNAKTGKEMYTQQRLDGIDGLYGSPVGAKGRVYIAGRDGTTLVIKNADKYEVLASNELDDEFDASPALAGNEIYLRGKKSLYCIAEK
ncbi:MAG: PQQ-binding-like beta-propeller repeat protein [Phycisphaerales bacterium]|nr:PQQ-binding-like beta-propeller repeat protein [Phycisphaerales bacterium]MCB9862714.1 PQQ-binding-like beta-propeller repeat protein [Phycisphaerales bacterium]